jgi:L-alanine-DL-glutamate epimerase-like enolase superfamily enzyme
MFEFPLWDLAGQSAGRPVYALAAEAAQMPVPDALRVRCYDTSLYMDDLHLGSDDEAAALIAGEASDGFALGHRAFKIKVGRGARWMPPEAGTRRDIAVVRAVRAAVGPDAALMLDANNGWNLNLTKQVLAKTAGCGIYWMEEAFHEDAVLYRDLKAWLRAEGLPTLIADGEGEASPSLLRWAQEGWVDVVQYDIFGYGLTRWLALGKQLDDWGARSAPHHYGGHLGNHISCHLAPALRGFIFAEWDEAAAPGLDTSGYVLEDGWVSVPNAPGFGLSLEDDAFAQAVAEGGWKSPP